MAAPSVKYGTALLAISVPLLLLYFLDYSNLKHFSVISNIQNRTIVASSVDGRGYFQVSKYELKDDVLHIIGQFNISDQNETTRLDIAGMSYLLHIIKPYALQDDKFVRAELQHEHFFKARPRVTNVDCRAIVQGDSAAIDYANNIQQSYEKHYIQPSDYMNLTKNCSEFIFNRNYITESLTEVERDFPIAYSILMYKDVEQSERLLRAIYRPQNVYCIHVDAKSSDEIYKAMSSIANCFDNVFMASKRVSVIWGQFSVLEPELLCMEELWNKSKTWKYFINLTGQEFPLRTNYELVRVLQEYNGANDVEGTRKRANKDRWAKLDPPPHNITPTKGAVHVIVSRAFVNYALHDQRAKDFLNWTKYTSIPDETFFASLNHNPEIGVPGAYKGLAETDGSDVKPFVARYKNWYGSSCHGKLAHAICIMSVGDLPALANSKKIIVNKLHLDYQPFALDCLEELIYNRTRDEYIGTLAFDSRWYGTLGFVKNKV